MTFPSVDWDALLSSPSRRWRERGLHWHCYTWRGSGKDWADDQARNSASAEVTPSMVRDWLKKPSKLIRATHSIPEDAVTWLRQVWTPVTQEALNESSIDWEFRYKVALYDLRAGNDLSWGMWTRGPSMMSVGIVGTAERCH